jgi:hypothetical protein
MHFDYDSVHVLWRFHGLLGTMMVTLDPLGSLADASNRYQHEASADYPAHYTAPFRVPCVTIYKSYRILDTTGTTIRATIRHTSYRKVSSTHHVVRF